jgi:pimeloyl-ACP methyl ester carboxylesterase
VYFHSTQDSLRLGGDLILPRGRGPFPAAVFVTGSDADTRETWQTEARALAARGIAALIYDKRGVGESRGASHDLASWDDLAGDVAGAVAYLRSRSDVVDPRRIGLIGQSQGTWLITKVAAADPDIAFMVYVSGGAMSAAEQETYRTGALMRRDGFSPEDIARAQAFQRRKFAVARTGFGWEQLDAEMQRLRADSVRWFPGYGTGAASRTLAGLRLYGVLQFNYDPRRDLARIAAPILVLVGEDDVVFPPDSVVARMRAVLDRGNRRITAHILPRTPHGMTMLQTSGGRPFRRVASAEFIRILADWVAGAVGPSGVR